MTHKKIISSIIFKRLEYASAKSAIIGRPRFECDKICAALQRLTSQKSTFFSHSTLGPSIFWAYDIEMVYILDGDF